MKAGSITFSTALDNAQLEKDLKALTKKIEKTERDIADLTVKRDAAQKKSIFDAAELDAEKAKLQEMKDRLADLRAMLKDKSLSPAVRETYAAQLPRLQEDVAEQRERVRGLQTEWNKTESAAERYRAKLAEAEQTLERQQAEAGHLAERIEEAKRSAGGMSGALAKANDQMKKFLTRVKNLATRVFVFTLITTALRGIRTWLWNSIKTSDEATQAIARLKGALLTMAQPLIEVIIPAFTLLVNILTRVATVVAKLISALFGKTLAQSKDNAKALYEEANGINAVGEAAEDAAGSLAGFDEINTISTDSGSSGNSSASSIAPDFNFDTGTYKSKLDELMVYLSGAALAIGALLFFSGANIPLGLGLMVLGAAGLAQAVAENWGAADGKIRDAVNSVLLILGGALLVIGAILAFSGVNLALGIGLMAVGAAMLASAAALNWSSMSAELQAALTALMVVVGASLLVIGAILAFSGANIPLGIALMLLGAAALAEVVALNWDSIGDELRSALSEILLVVGEFLIVLGVLLVLSGANIPLGIGLILLGAAALAGAAALDWENVSGRIQSILSELLMAIGAATLVLGALLVFSATNIPLGIGLILVGAASLAAGAALNWDEVSGQISSIISVLTGILSVAFLAMGAVLTFSGANIPLGIALLVLGVAGVGLAKLNWDAISTALQGPIGRVTAIASAALLALGVIICFSGVGLPLGIALIAAGATGLVTVAALNWNALKEKLSETWQGIKSWWDSNVAKYLSLDYWKEKGADIIDGFKKGIKDKWDSLTSWFNNLWDSLFGKKDVSVNVSATSSAGSVIANSGSSASRAAAYSMPDISGYSIPALARGAVIPPNREFLAVLGDQRSGNNLELPESLLRQAVREESGSSGDTEALLRSILEAVKAGHIIEVDGTVFGRTAIRTINSANTAAGKQLLLI